MRCFLGGLFCFILSSSFVMHYFLALFCLVFNIWHLPFQFCPVLFFIFVLGCFPAFNCIVFHLFYAMFPALYLLCFIFVLNCHCLWVSASKEIIIWTLQEIHHGIFRCYREQFFYFGKIIKVNWSWSHTFELFYFKEFSLKTTCSNVAYWFNFLNLQKIQLNVGVLEKNVELRGMVCSWQTCTLSTKLQYFRQALCTLSKWRSVTNASETWYQTKIAKTEF